MVQSAYIHIPFCHKICHYCDFVKFFYDEKMADDYLLALEREIETTLSNNKAKVKTIFIGGGTPTALTPKQLTSLMEIIHNNFEVDKCEEFSIEANPGEFSLEKMKILKDFGINRLSLGVQVFDDDQLEVLGRFHKVEDVYQTMEDITTTGFLNVSLDLIYALPEQTITSFEQSLHEALQFNLPHYSAYSLIIEPQTIFYNMNQMGQLHLPSHEDEADMFELLQQTMINKGYEHYEISNFARKGFESKHNLTYWNNDYYFGFGAGSHGYVNQKRTINIRPIPAYIKACMEDGSPILKVEELSLKEQIEEEFFLGLRKRTGVSKKRFEKKFGLTCNTVYEKEIKYLVEKGWLRETAEHLALTEQGIMFGNEVFTEFLLDNVNF